MVDSRLVWLVLPAIFGLSLLLLPWDALLEQPSTCEPLLDDIHWLDGTWVGPAGEALEVWTVTVPLTGGASAIEGYYRVHGPWPDPPPPGGHRWNFGSTRPVVVLNLVGNAGGRYAALACVTDDVVRVRVTPDPAAAIAPGFLAGPDTMALQRVR